MLVQLQRIEEEEEGEVHWNKIGKKHKNFRRLSLKGKLKCIRLLLNIEKAMLRLIYIISLC